MSFIKEQSTGSLVYHCDKKRARKLTVSRSYNYIQAELFISVDFEQSLSLGFKFPRHKQLYGSPGISHGIYR